MSTRSYLVGLTSVLGLVVAAWLATGCGSSRPPETPPILLALCQSQLVQLGAEPAFAEALCKAGGDALTAELARLRAQASARAVPCADTPAPAPPPPVPASVGTGGGP